MNKKEMKKLLKDNIKLQEIGNKHMKDQKRGIDIILKKK